MIEVFIFFKVCCNYIIFHRNNGESNANRVVLLYIHMANIQVLRAKKTTNTQTSKSTQIYESPSPRILISFLFL